MSEADVFRVRGPALISFSGGRTSGYMLWRILQAHGGTLPADVHVTFANTGKEMPQTLDFVRDCGERWAVDIAWLEYRDAEPKWARVEYATASRAGEPYSALIKKKKYLPNPVTRFCTIELKIRVMRDYARSLGWDHWSNVLGLRADEPQRVSKSRARNGVERWDNEMPLALAGVTKADVVRFWEAQNFDLHLPNHSGVTFAGNCDLCFLKSARTLTALMREKPALADWWIEAEAQALTSKPSGARFRQDRPSYAALLHSAQSADQGRLFPDDRDRLIDCFCGEPS